MPKINIKILVIIFLVTVIGFFSLQWRKNTLDLANKQISFWQMQSVDTVKYSRDLARQYEKDTSYDKEIDLQVKSIASSGANFVAIGTPYDKEFVPFLKRWVDSARKYGLNVWFRGNFSGWEEWFEYPAITRAEHEKMLKQFILDNGSLFQDGDVFTACTECENGGPGDPRQTGDASGHRQFLINEYQIGRNAFSEIGKNVATNYFPMNADVAKLIMNPETTKALGGIVVIDHYVPTPQDLDQGVTDLAESSGGKVVLGEFGAPIPDLHGKLTEAQQADWIKSALTLLADNKNLIGVNYWTSFGGSIELWDGDGNPRLAVSVIKNYFVPKVIRGIVSDEIGSPIMGVKVSDGLRMASTNTLGQFYFPYISDNISLTASAEGYTSVKMNNLPKDSPITVVLKKQKEGFFFRFRKLLHSL